ncbi:MAG TPA: Holliday junction resolvase RuvX [Firmicutes bacterium]|nr:Holliday junction resolvase RuvX [Bacillota bacterium]
MRSLGLDLGTKTLGLALSDKTNTIASPYKVLRYENEDYDMLFKELDIIIKEKEITNLVLGLPKNMNNSLGFASDRSLKFKDALENRYHLEVTLIDERLSTVEATNYLLEADMSRKKRKKVIDGVAASIILDTYLKMKGN